MADIGRVNKLTIVKQVPFGVYLDGGDHGEILLPRKFVPADAQVGDEVEVFIHHDSEDELIATTQRPRALVGQFAYLQVVSVTKVGAFLDWGLAKDLLVPYPQQRRPMQEGKSYIVYLNLDQEGRIVATSKIDKYLDKWPPRYKAGEEVKLLIAEHTDLGYKAIVNDRHWGVIHDEDVFKALRYGKREKGYIKKVREDGKIDLSLRKTGRDKISDLADRVLAALVKNNGYLPLHDKSSPEQIKQAFGESKKAFKSAIGFLYKQGKVELEKEGIRLLSDDNS